jgi:DNA-directed RNA polymerase specialized sigma24 family protein
MAQRRFGIEKADVDDAVQKVFIVAYGVLQTQRVESERAWLSAITRRVCANERRNLRLRREMEAQAMEPTPSVGPDSHLMLKQMLHALRKVRQHELVELMCFDGLSLHGAAGRMGVSVSSATSRLQSAKCTLIRHLDGAPQVEQARR